MTWEIFKIRKGAPSGGMQKAPEILSNELKQKLVEVTAGQGFKVQSVLDMELQAVSEIWIVAYKD